MAFEALHDLAPTALSSPFVHHFLPCSSHWKPDPSRHSTCSFCLMPFIPFSIILQGLAQILPVPWSLNWPCSPLLGQNPSPLTLSSRFCLNGVHHTGPSASHVTGCACASLPTWTGKSFKGRGLFLPIFLPQDLAKVHGSSAGGQDEMDLT